MINAILGFVQRALEAQRMRGDLRSTSYALARVHSRNLQLAADLKYQQECNKRQYQLIQELKDEGKPMSTVKLWLADLPEVTEMIDLAAKDQCALLNYAVKLEGYRGLDKRMLASLKDECEQLRAVIEAKEEHKQQLEAELRAERELKS